MKLSSYLQPHKVFGSVREDQLTEVSTARRCMPPDLHLYVVLNKTYFIMMAFIAMENVTENLGSEFVVIRY